MMAIPDSDPRARELDAAFEAAANGPAKPRAEAKTPGEVDREAPFGREDDGTPKTPYGTNKDGSPRRTAGGRRSKDDQSRVAEGKPADAKPDTRAKPEPHDWSGDLEGAADTVWFGLTFASRTAPKIPVIGKLVPGEKLAAEAFVLDTVKPQLVGAVNLAAQHNVKVADFCRKLEGSDSLWAFTVMFMVAPVIEIAATVWRADPDELKKAELPTLAEMAKRNEAKMDDMLDRIQAQIAQAAQAAQAAPAEHAQAA